MNEHQREVADLIYNSHPTKQFIDERVYAAHFWSLLYRSEIKAYKAQAGTEPEPSRIWRNEKAKQDYERLQEQAISFWQTRQSRFKKLAQGPDSFPIDKMFEEIDREYPTASYDATIDQLVESSGVEKYSQEASRLRSALTVCNLHLQSLKKREACELVIWSRALTETLREISFFEETKTKEIGKATNDK